MTNATVEMGTEPQAVAIASRYIRQINLSLAVFVFAIVVIGIGFVVLAFDLPSFLGYAFSGTAFLAISFTFFFRANCIKQSYDTLLCNECNLAAYRQVMNLAMEKAPLRRYAHRFALNSLAASILRGDYDEAHKMIFYLDEQYDSLKSKKKFELDMHKWELDLAETPGDEARHEQTFNALLARWKNPPRGVPIQRFLQTRGLHHYAAAGDWNSFGTALTTMPISSVLTECTYHWLRSQWCAGTGASIVPDLTFVAEHGGDMFVANEARKKLAELSEEQRTLSPEQHIPSCAPQVSRPYNQARLVAILLLILSLLDFVFCFLSTIAG